MVPMAIPSFGGMLVVLVSVFFVPVLYSMLKEFMHYTSWGEGALTVFLLLTLVVPGFIFILIYCAVRRIMFRMGIMAAQ